MTINKDKLPILEENPDAVPLEVLADKPALPAHIWRTNSRGLIEAIDVSNGRVLAMQTSHEDLLKEKWERLIRVDTPEGPVYLERGLNFDIVNKLRAMPYSQVLADLVCQEVANGASLIKACQKLNLEYATISRWKREQETFRLGLEQADKDRAQYLAEEVLDEAREKATPKDKIAALQWAAEKGNAEKFGTKTKLIGGSQGPTVFVIETGIRRSGDAGFVSHEAKDVTPLSGPTEQTGEVPQEIEMPSFGVHND